MKDQRKADQSKKPGQQKPEPRKAEQRKLSTPIYLKTSTRPAKPEEGFYYLLTADGLFVCRNTPFFSSAVRARTGPAELQRQTESLEISYPMVPQALLELTVGYFARVADLYDAEAAVPKELERRFRLSDQVLRYLTVNLEPDWAQFEKQEAVREAKRRAEAEIAEAARQKALKEEAAAKEAKEKEEAEQKAAAEAEEAEQKAADSAEASDDEPAAEAAPTPDEAGGDEPSEAPATDEAEAEKA